MITKFYLNTAALLKYKHELNNIQTKTCFYICLFLFFIFFFWGGGFAFLFFSLTVFILYTFCHNINCRFSIYSALKVAA